MGEVYFHIRQFRLRTDRPVSVLINKITMEGYTEVQFVYGLTEIS